MTSRRRSQAQIAPSGQCHAPGNEAAWCRARVAERSLTPIEHRYVQSRLRDQRLGRWTTLVFGGGAMCFATLLIQLFLSDGIGAASIFVLVVGTLSIILLCAMLRVIWQRRFAVDEHVSLLRGTVAVYATQLPNPQTGGRTTSHTFYIGKQRLILPFDFERTCRQMVNQTVDAFVVYVHKSNPLNWGRPGELMHEGPTEAIVLDLADQLHVHGLLSTYGENYFLRRKLRATLSGLGMMLFVVGGMLASNQLLGARPSVTALIVSVIAVCGASVLFMLWLGWAYDAAERRWAPLVDTRDHSERLRFTAKGSRANRACHGTTDLTSK